METYRVSMPGLWGGERVFVKVDGKGRGAGGGNELRF